MLTNTLLLEFYIKLTGYRYLHSTLYTATNNTYYTQTLPNLIYRDGYYYRECRHWLVANGGAQMNLKFIFIAKIVMLFSDYLVVLVNYLLRSSGVGFTWSQARVETLPDFYWLLYIKRI